VGGVGRVYFGTVSTVSLEKRGPAAGFCQALSPGWNELENGLASGNALLGCPSSSNGDEILPNDNKLGRVFGRGGDLVRGGDLERGGALGCGGDLGLGCQGKSGLEKWSKLEAWWPPLCTSDLRVHCRSGLGRMQVVCCQRAPKLWKSLSSSCPPLLIYRNKWSICNITAIINAIKLSNTSRHIRLTTCYNLETSASSFGWVFSDIYQAIDIRQLSVLFFQIPNIFLFSPCDIPVLYGLMMKYQSLLSFHIQMTSIPAKTRDVKV